MQQDLLKHAMSLFDTSDKWNAFYELALQADKIKDFYFSKVRAPLTQYFIDNPVEGWDFEPWGDVRYDLRWFLKDFGKSSVALGVGWRFNFVMTLEDTTGFDNEKVNQLLSSSEYAKLVLAFERTDIQFEQRRKFAEVGNYYFNSPNDSNFTEYQLAWYAGNNTDEFVKQIAAKVDRFRKDAEVTRLLHQLNEQSRK